MKIEVTGNTAVHNGAVRLFWSSPNYGYFDVNKVVKPTPIIENNRIGNPLNFNFGYGV
jgi:hypothetical protein